VTVSDQADDVIVENDDYPESTPPAPAPVLPVPGQRPSLPTFSI